MPSLTRRELLAAGAGGAAALALGGCGDDSVPRPLAGAATAPSTTPPAMRKGISLIGADNAYDDRLGVRAYLRGGPHPTAFVSLWILWPDVQPVAPNPFTPEQAISDLADPAGPGAVHLAALDAQIAQAKADGCEVALTLYQSFPDWTRPPGAPARADHVPADLGADGPWAWFITFLCARYARGGAGNPAGAAIDWLAPMNEPNLTWWPQRSSLLLPDGTMAGAVAQLARIAGTIAAATPGGPGLLLPGTADVVGERPRRGTSWEAFSAGVLARLRDWEPGVPVAWAHHNYADVKHGPEADGRWRVERLLELQARHGWPEPAVWLTEGGYQFSVRRDGWLRPDLERWLVEPGATADPAHPDVYAEQVAALRENWTAMARLPVRLWTQYQVHDRDVRFQSSLRGPIRDTASGPALNDPPYPAYDLWPQLAA